MDQKREEFVQNEQMTIQVINHKQEIIKILNKIFSYELVDLHTTRKWL